MFVRPPVESIRNRGYLQLFSAAPMQALHPAGEKRPSRYSVFVKPHGTEVAKRSRSNAGVAATYSHRKKKRRITEMLTRDLKLPTWKRTGKTGREVGANPDQQQPRRGWTEGQAKFAAAIEQ
jgi:hypothetical protein